MKIITWLCANKTNKRNIWHIFGKTTFHEILLETLLTLWSEKWLNRKETLKDGINGIIDKKTSKI